MRARPFIALLLALAAACGAEEAGSAKDGDDGGATPLPTGPVRPAGPIANAGADQRVLEGMPVRLDGRASRPGEEGLPLAMRWTQEAGPRVSLDDPTSAEPWFVAPPIQPARERRLVFRLTVFDGQRSSSDRVVVELVGEPARIVPPPIAVAGADLAVRPGDEVQLPAPFTLDPACLDEGGAPDCAEEAAIPTRYVLVDALVPPRVDPAGLAIDLQANRFVAPPHDAILTFRLDAHRPMSSVRLDDCAPDGPLPGAAYCAAPDFLRVFVQESGFDQAPTAEYGMPLGMPRRGGLFRVGPGATGDEYAPVSLWVSTADPDGDLVTLRGFRPVLAGAPPGALPRIENMILEPGEVDEAGVNVRAPPRTVAVAFESRAGRLFSAPVVAAVRWEPPEGSALPVADAGPNPCLAPLCTPFVGGEIVTLDGSGSSDEDTPAEALTFCWRQTFGPPVRFLEEDEGLATTASCITGEPRRTFVAPAAPQGGGALHLSFVLTVHDGGPLVSRPDTTVVQIRPVDDEPPEVVAVAPEAVDEGESVLLDASASRDPEGGPLSFRWTQLGLHDRVELVEVRCPGETAVSGACSRFTAPAVVSDTPLRFEVAVADGAGLAASRTVEVLVRNSTNEPPVADAGADRIAAPGETVVIEGSATDPNPGDGASLARTWHVVRGGVSLATSGATATFVAPEVEEDTEVVLELRITDRGGASDVDRVSIWVLAEGPRVAPGGDDGATGSPVGPVATLERGLALAAAHGFRTLLLAEGTYVAAGALELDGVTVRGGHVPGADWARTGAASRVVLPAGAVLGEGAGLEKLLLEAGDAAPLLVQGPATLRDVRVEGEVVAAAGSLRIEGSTIQGAATALRCAGPASVELRRVELAAAETAVEIADGCGGFLEELAARSGGAGVRLAGAAAVRIERSVVESSGAAGWSTGIEVAGGAGLEVVNAVVVAGGAGDAAALAATGPIDLHSSLLRILPGAPGGAEALRLGAGGAVLRNLILDGGDGAGRAHLRLEPGAEPAVLYRVLFVADPGCSAGGAYVRRATEVACSVAAIRAIDAGWDPLLGDPHWIDPAAGDYRLGLASAAVDTGTSDGAPAVDLGGAVRGGDGNGDGAPGWDIGPWER